MDGYEATRIVYSRIQRSDPENASKIMGLLLIQDHGEKEMIRLAFGPEALVHSIILKAKKDLSLLPPSPTNNSPSTPPSPSPFSANSRLITNKIPPPLTIPNPPSSEDGPPSTGKMNSSALPYYSNGGGDVVLDELQFQEQLSFLNENNKTNNHDLFYPPLDLSSTSPPNSDSPPLLFPSSYWSSHHHQHRRSCSVSDVMGSSGSIDDINSGLGWRPCMYFARGYCKNGSTCRFIHGAESMVSEQLVGSPNKIETGLDQTHELIRSKSAVQQRLAAAAAVAAAGASGGGCSQLISNSSAFPYSPKSMNLFLQQNDSQRAALLLNEDLHKFNRSRLERSDFSSGLVNPASRQIYLTFPADSTFREEDVSNYFSSYGPVQDVRIPYQQKRMFGFVTFVYPETVKIILAKGNPHFVCDARVLVKPYKEKGKVPDKYRKQPSPVERGDYSPCGTPTGLDSRDPFDLPLGSRMFYNTTQDMLWRRKMEEQADLQQALELQSRRLMGLQLLDVKKNHHHHHRALSTGSPIPSPTHSPNVFHQSVNLGLHHPFQNSEISKETMPNISVSAARKEENSSSNSEDDDLLDNLEHNLPDSPFASPTKVTTTGEYLSGLSSNVAVEKDATTSSSNNNLVMIPPNASSSLDMAASFKSFNCQRFSSGGIGMYSGTGGPTCPVGI